MLSSVFFNGGERRYLPKNRVLQNLTEAGDVIELKKCLQRGNGAE